MARTESASRILVVEDDEQDAFVIGQLLSSSKLDCKSVQVGNVKQAVEALKRIAFDCVILDLAPPDAQGIRAVTMVKQYSADTPLIVVSGNRDAALRDECLDAGVSFVFNKGRLEPKTFVEKVHTTSLNYRYRLDQYVA